MSNPINNGGPAFPSAGIITPDGILCEGMTLRDYFAAKVVQAAMSNPDSRKVFLHSVKEVGEDEACLLVAEHGYAMADAMLKAREVQP